MTKYPLRCRNGSSLVEALAAITLLCIGALAITTTGVASLRLETGADRRSRAAASVSTRLELLHHSGCLSSSGTDSALGVHATWHTAAIDSIQKTIDSVLITDRLAARPVREVIESAAPC